MFIHQSQLEYLIPSDWYTAAEQHDLEVERMFRQAWHVVGSKADLPKSGDFKTMELLGEPLQIRNFDGDYHCFLNICAHRHCLLTCEERGRSERLRCQYHGWEYEAGGQTRHIPEARSFRPFDRENARLHKFPLETAGDILFVRLSADGPSLREFLGDYYELMEERFSSPWRQNWAWERSYDSNWKIPVENTLESYHMHFVHKGTFATAKSTAEKNYHVLDDRYTTVHYDVSENRLLGGLQSWSARQLGVPSKNVYTHHHIHPNFVLTVNDFLCHAQSYWPLTPTSCRTLIRMYSYRPITRNPWRWWMGVLAAKSGRDANLKIQLEDSSIFGPVQQGIERTRHQGCIGTREERVYVFQRYVKRMCETGRPDGPPEPPHLESADASRHSPLEPAGTPAD